jgi:hypothetical protein
VKSQTPNSTNQETVNIGRISPGLLSPHQCEIPILASHTLWRSLIWSYPSASPAEHLNSRQLRDDLVQCLKRLGTYSRHAFFYPSERPCWLHPEFLIKVQLYCVGGEVALVVLLLPDEYRPSPPVDKKRVLPVGLLGSLLRALHNLRLVARTADFFPLDEMLRTIDELASSHPLRPHFCSHSAAFNPANPTHLSDTDYRDLLLIDLQRLVSIVSAIAPTPLSSKLEHDYDAFFATSSELLDIIESLAALAAKSPESSTRQVSSFKNLLWAYRQAYELVRRGTSQPPAFLLQGVNDHFSPISKMLPECFASELHDLFQRFYRLQERDNAPPDSACYASTTKPIWH